MLTELLRLYPPRPLVVVVVVVRLDSSLTDNDNLLDFFLPGFVDSRWFEFKSLKTLFF